MSLSFGDILKLSQVIFCYREFYDDVVKELKTYGELVQFKVCCNAEPHLRGNVYAQYTSKRAAMKAYQALQGRYYSGKQLKVEFTRIPSWKSAICGKLLNLSSTIKDVNIKLIVRAPKENLNVADQYETSRILFASLVIPFLSVIK